MERFAAFDRGLRRRTLALGLAGLGVAAVTCRTPPPLPKAPSEADNEARPAPVASERTNAVAESRSASTPASPPETAPEEDFSHEQKELAERYAKRRALSTLRGEATYYGRAFAGRKTASGETFEPRRYTAAHRTLPFGTVLRVTRVGTPSVVYVRVNDRGPFGKKHRILDLSEAAAGELDMLRDGVCNVRVEVLERGKP
ncbi:MAG TPA: septal ring lytic transglycosylase RlpA family protein [Polyangiaceae bacterium]